MINAKKFKEVFGVNPDTQMLILECPLMETCQWRYGNACHCEDWWSAEYQEPVIRDNEVKGELNRVKDELEPTTKNCETCKYNGSHHGMCKYCYKCSLWTEQEPTTKNEHHKQNIQTYAHDFGVSGEQAEKELRVTTKNDLGVDREDAVERLNAIKQLIGYDKDSEIVKATQKSLDMAIKALEQEPRKDEVILTNKEYRELIANEYEHGYCKGYEEASEGQAPVIDKIRAEIEQTHKTMNGFFMHEGTKKTILSIIDRYKTESEE